MKTTPDGGCLKGQPEGQVRGRGATANPGSRFNATCTEPMDDGWGPGDGEAPALRTTVEVDASRTIVSHNQSPDLPFEQSVNPYRGCEHGCIYCYARPGHAWLGLSPGLDFESRLFAKPDAPRLLARELSRPAYRCRALALGTFTDPYQPVERRWRITRGILELLWSCRHPVSLVTKSALVERDLDLLAPMARENLVQVQLSVTTLDRALARSLEPRAAAPQRRLGALRRLSEAGIPCGVLVAPVIPRLTDHELEAILEAAAGAGARWADYVLLRLPGEVAGLFEAWLEARHPLKARAVMQAVRAARGGQVDDPRFGHRMRGEGEYARLLARRFELACRRLGLGRECPPLDTRRFRPPSIAGDRQLSLF